MKAEIRSTKEIAAEILLSLNRLEQQSTPPPLVDQPHWPPLRPIPSAPSFKFGSAVDHSPPPARFSQLEMPLFSGSHVWAWLFQIESFFAYHQIPPHEKIGIAAFYMTGDALVWFQGLHTSSQVTSWECFAGELRLRFGPSTLYDHQLALSKLHQHTTVSAFMAEFEKLATLTSGLTNDNFLNTFVSGLCEDIRKELVIMKPQTLSEAMGLATLLEDKPAETPASVSPQNLPTEIHLPREDVPPLLPPAEAAFIQLKQVLPEKPVVQSEPFVGMQSAANSEFGGLDGIHDVSCKPVTDIYTCLRNQLLPVDELSPLLQNDFTEMADEEKPCADALSEEKVSQAQLHNYALERLINGSDNTLSGHGLKYLISSTDRFASRAWQGTNFVQLLEYSVFVFDPGGALLLRKEPEHLPLEIKGLFKNFSLTDQEGTLQELRRLLPKSQHVDPGGAVPVSDLYDASVSLKNLESSMKICVVVWQVLGIAEKGRIDIARQLEHSDFIFDPGGGLTIKYKNELERISDDLERVYRIKFLSNNDNDEAFEWYAKWPEFRSLLHIEILGATNDSSLELAANSDFLSWQLHGVKYLYDVGFQRITNFDPYKAVTSDMLLVFGVVDKSRAWQLRPAYDQIQGMKMEQHLDYWAGHSPKMRPGHFQEVDGRA